MTKKTSIPRLPYLFFKWYCRSDRFEELHGDLEEMFYDRLDEFGHSKASFYYYLDVLRCCQSYAWKKSTTQNTTIVMLKNYYKTSSRSLMKNPLNAFINVFGLSLAIGICMLVYGFTKYVYSIDQHHVNKESVFLTTIFVERDGTMQQNGLTPRPLATMLKEDFPQVRNTCRVEDQNAIVKHKDNVFHEQVRYVDPSFLEMFTFPLKWGVQDALGDMNSVVLSAQMAEKYFGSENPIGKDLQIIFGLENSKLFKVAGVAEEFPKASDIRFSFLLNFDNLAVGHKDYDEHDWGELLKATFIQLDEPHAIAEIEASMDKYKVLQNEAQNTWEIHDFAFEPLATLYERSPNIQSDISYGRGDNAASVIFLGIIGLFMLALACLNYINIAIVSATKRLKEIGVRKSIGATRQKVITQFLTENILVTTIALVFGFILGTAVIIPWFEAINDFSMEFTIYDPLLLIYLPLILLLTGVASGLYPSLYISKFHVSKIFKGSVEFGKKNPLTKIFLGFQLILACILITSAVVFTQNTRYTAKRGWGYNQKDVLYTAVSGEKEFDQLKALMQQESAVRAISGAANHVGTSALHAVVTLPPNNKYDVKELAVEANYFNIMGLKVIEGRDFNNHPGSDRQAIIVNETLVKNLKLDKPLGMELGYDSSKFEIIGIVKDFHSNNFFYPIEPIFFRVAEPENYQYLAMQVEDGEQSEVYAKLRQNWSSLFPEIPFQGGHQEDVWGLYYAEINGHTQFWQVIAIIAVMLAALGLYGLVTLNVSGRTKELSIRKVLGARLDQILSVITRQYTWLFVIALAIGAPASFFLISFVLDFAYAYHMPINYSGVATAVFLLIAVLLTTVFTQIGRLSKTNPVEGLKTE
ncbi:ABC transporter permease [Fulvivirga aurantia]|uniref:ABC transporter permease n=1 Tax=Fulvivirga aurantia TaxID=2529383 RepID=UPI00162A0DB1|nr:FtsX-like permease family protein [Fulvivirga aurantia]